MEFHLIGDTETPLGPEHASRIHVTGRYEEAELPGLLARLKPDLVWFPAAWPETYGYTLSAALEAGLPIAASCIGSFPKRLGDRALSWIAAADAPAGDWLTLFTTIRATLSGGAAPIARRRPAIPDFYARDYLVPRSPTPRTSKTVDLRRPGRLSVIVVPERFADGTPTPCAFIRLLLPLAYPPVGEGIDVTLATPAEALAMRADILATQRHAIPDIAADAIAAHCRAHRMTLLFDLDDDLLDVSKSHPEATILRPRARIIARMLRHADAVFVSTSGLKQAVATIRPDAVVVRNALDERLWDLPKPSARPRPVRILCMGTLTHDADFDIVAPALERLHLEFGRRVGFHLIGFTNRVDLPPWIDRVAPSPNARRSYPGFVDWIARQRFDIGIAPLSDTGFNAAKSAIKTMDYAALELAVLASDVPAFRGSLTGGPVGTLVAATENAWFAALSALVRDPALRRQQAEWAQAEWRRGHTMQARAAAIRTAWLALKPI